MTSDGLELICNTIKSNVCKCQILINGSYKDVPIEKFEVTSSSIKIYIYIDEDTSGTITKYKLVTTKGIIFDEKNDNISKDNKRGLLTVFEYRIKEV